MEILHKWREVRILEDELDRGQQLKTLLEKLILNGIPALGDPYLTGGLCRANLLAEHGALLELCRLAAGLESVHARSALLLRRRRR